MLSDNIERKFINTWDIEDFQILTDDGFVDIKSLHETIPYIKYHIETFNGLTLDCADNHIVFDENMNEIFVKNLRNEDKIMTANGIDTIICVECTNIEENMYDFELDENSNHRYYTNGILSHNTLLVKSIAKMLDVPISIVDCNSITEAGYVGDDVETSITRLLQACDYDVKKAEHGIVFLDECFDGNTEVMTENGFIPFKDLTDSTKIMQWNSDSTMSLVNSERIVKHKCLNGLLSLQNSKTGQIIHTSTPNHNRVVISHGKYRDKYIIKKSNCRKIIKSRI